MSWEAVGMGYARGRGLALARLYRFAAVGILIVTVAAFWLLWSAQQPILGAIPGEEAALMVGVAGILTAVLLPRFEPRRPD